MTPICSCESRICSRKLSSFLPDQGWNYLGTIFAFLLPALHFFCPLTGANQEVWYRSWPPGLYDGSGSEPWTRFRIRSRCRYWLRVVLPALASNSGIAVRSHLLLALGLAGGERLFVMVTHSSSLSLWFYSLIYTLEVPVCPCGLQRRLINYGCNKDEFLET